MTLTHVLTQTHRHYAARSNSVTVEHARDRAYPLLATCGRVWIPGAEEEVADLPLCHHCQNVGPRHWPDRGATFVYRCFDADDRLLYVGCTRSPLERVQAHAKNTWWWPQVRQRRFLVFEDRGYALCKEGDAIASEKPLWNVRGQNYANYSLAELRLHASIAVSVGAPDKYLLRYQREALKHHGAGLLEAV